MSMKKFFLLTMLTAISVNIHGAENMNKHNYGYQKYEKQTVDSINENGFVSLEKTKVLGPVQINGSLQAEESEINSLLVNGQVNLNNCLITNTSVINGSLNATGTDFQKNLSIASQKIILRTCTIESLTVREVAGYTEKQVVDLSSGTHVTGSIVFESNHGEVWISSDSTISQDQVFGAQVYKK